MTRAAPILLLCLLAGLALAAGDIVLGRPSQIIWAAAGGNNWVAQFGGTVALDPALRAWWRLNEGTGTNCADSAGGYTGRFIGTPVWTNGPAGPGALAFASGKAVIAAHGGALNVGSSNVTLSVWFKSYGTGAGNDYLMHTAPSGQNRWVLYLAAGVPSMFCAPNSGFDQCQATASIIDGAWHHVAAIISNRAPAAVYVDGVQKKLQSNAPGAGAIDGSGNVYLADATSWLKGGLDDARIYFRGLSSNEIYAIYAAGAQ